MEQNRSVSVPLLRIRAPAPTASFHLPFADRWQRAAVDCRPTAETALRQMITSNEVERLAAVRRYDILDTPSDGAFDRITRLAARHFNVPICIVSIVDHDRIWFKSHHGLETSEIPRDPGLCSSAILDNKPWVLTDAKVDPRSLANPLVAGEFGLRFYAGFRTRDGFSLGTLCIIDHAPRQVSNACRELAWDSESICPRRGEALSRREPASHPLDGAPP